VDYASALLAADHFLQAWQSGDTENGMALLTSRAKKSASADEMERFFSGSAPSAYEIGRGKLVKAGRYEFPVVLVSSVPKNSHSRRRFSTIIVLHSGGNDWAVDKLP
jgi:hypothetical protein